MHVELAIRMATLPCLAFLLFMASCHAVCRAAFVFQFAVPVSGAVLLLPFEAS